MDNSHVYMISGSIGKDVTTTEFLSKANPNILYLLDTYKLQEMKDIVKDNKYPTYDIALNTLGDRSRINIFKDDTRSIITVDKTQLMTHMQTTKKIDHNVNVVLDMGKLCLGYERLDIIEHEFKSAIRSTLSADSLADIVLPFKNTAPEKIHLHIGDEKPLRIQMGNVTADLAPRISDSTIDIIRPMHESKKHSIKAEQKITVTKQSMQTLNKLSKELVELKISRLSDTDIAIHGMDPAHVCMINGFVGENAAQYKKNGLPSHLTWYSVRDNAFDDHDYLALEHLVLLDRESYTINIDQICKKQPSNPSPPPNCDLHAVATIDQKKLIDALKKISKQPETYGTGNFSNESILVKSVSDPETKEMRLFALNEIILKESKSQIIIDGHTQHTECRYNVLYLLDFLKAIPKTNKSILIEFDAKKPMLIQTTHDQMALKFYMAPRVEN